MDSKAEASKYSRFPFTHSSNRGKWFVDEYYLPKKTKPDAEQSGDAGSGAMFSRSEATRANYEARIDALFNNGKAQVGT